MAALSQSQALTRSFSPSHSVLKRSTTANASKVHAVPFVLNPNLWLCRLTHGVFPSRHLMAVSSSSKWTFEKMVIQRGTLQNKRMSFAVKATAGNAEEDLMKKRIDFTPRYVEEPQEAIIYRLWIAAAGLAIFLFLFRNVMVSELFRWLKVAVLGLDFLINKGIMALYALLNPLIPLVVAVVRGIAFGTLIVKGAYVFIFKMISVQAFVEAIVFSSAVLGVGEAMKTNAVSSQPYTIGMAGFLGLGAVLGFFSSSLFVALLLALVAFSLMVMKRDTVSSVMPAAAVLAAVAEPWVRAVALASFLVLAVHQNWKSPEKEQVATGNGSRYKEQHIILRVLSLMVGITVAVQWLYFRHLIWLAK